MRAVLSAWKDRANVQNTDTGGIKTSQQKAEKKYSFVLHSTPSNWPCACTGRAAMLGWATGYWAHWAWMQLMTTLTLNEENPEERDVTPQFWYRLLPKKNKVDYWLSSKKDGEFFTIITKLLISVAYVKDHHPEYWNHVLPGWSHLHEIKNLGKVFFFPSLSFYWSVQVA